MGRMPMRRDTGRMPVPRDMGRMPMRRDTGWKPVPRDTGKMPVPRNAENFSGGNAQKLAVGRWLSGLQPVKLLVLDEPTQGIDVGARHEIYALIREFVAQPGRAVVFASSDPEEVETLATRVVVMADGRLTQELEPGGGEQILLEAAHAREAS